MMKHPPQSWGSTIFTGVGDLDTRYHAARLAADNVSRLKAQARETDAEIAALHRLGIFGGSKVAALNARRTKLRQLLPEASQTAMAENLALHAALFGAWRWLRDRARRVGIPLDENGTHWRRPFADFQAALAIVEKREAKMRS